MSPQRRYASRSGGGKRRGGSRRRTDDNSSQGPAVQEVVRPPGGPVHIPDSVAVAELSSRLGLPGIDVIKQLIRNGVMASLTQVVDYDTAALVARDFNFQPVREASAEKPHDLHAVHDQAQMESMEETATLITRPPVVTILGHVDHGKTTLLDAIRKTKVAEGEAGGITQHIGAYQVMERGQPITFLDTPGHAAFTAMRARGAQGADIAVLVVAADDGIMPQTIEAIAHARAAGVPIIVAINKVDKPEATVDRVKTQLTEHGVVLEDFGGDVIGVPVSAKTGLGITDLLDNILVVAEVADLKANPDRAALGVIIEAHVDRSRGPVASVLVQNGTLHVGDAIVAGEAWGRIKALYNDAGKRVREAGPSTPVEALGLSTLPQAGDAVVAFADDKDARDFVQKRQRERELRPAYIARAPILEELAKQAGAGQIRELPLIIKTDVQGSVEPVKTAIERLSTSEARVRVLHASAGMINDADILLAAASHALVVGFNVQPQQSARSMAATESVEIRVYNVIYSLTDEIEAALKGLLAPSSKEVVDGHAEVRVIFSLGKRGKVAGCYVTDGKITRNGQARLMRGGKLLAEGPIESLKRFKDDAREVTSGLECGIAIAGFNDYAEGDVIEAFSMQQVAR